MLVNNSIHILMALLLTVLSAFYFTSTAQQIETAKTCYKHFLDSTKIKCSSMKTCHTPTAQQGWISWLTGNSRSSQFHFLDLLELIESVDDSKQLPQST